MHVENSRKFSFAKALQSKAKTATKEETKKALSNYEAKCSKTDDTQPHSEDVRSVFLKKHAAR